MRRIQTCENVSIEFKENASGDALNMQTEIINSTQLFNHQLTLQILHKWSMEMNWNEGFGKIVALWSMLSKGIRHMRHILNFDIKIWQSQW
jgi:hypothetical protein